MKPELDPVVCVARSVGGAGRALVGCSGGSDSVALLAAAVEALGAERVVAGHVDHALRPDSAGDADFVRGLATRLGTASLAVRLSPLARRRRSPEDAARVARRDALLAMARESRCDTLLLAHQMDDVAETVLMRITTGAGPAGLLPMSRAPDGGGVRIVRPFLGLRREALRRWLGERGLAWRDDPTNASGNLRAVLRSRAIPMLSSAVRRDVVPVLARAGDLAQGWVAAGGDAAAEAWIERPGPEIRRLAPGWMRLHEVVRTDAIRRIMRELVGGRRTQLPGARDVDARLFGGGGLWCNLFHSRLLPDGSAEFTRIAPDRVPLPRLRVASGPPSTDLVVRLLCTSPRRRELLDAEKVARPLRIRRARPGDRFHALGGARPQRLTHFLQRAGVPAHERGVPVVVDASGRIAWVVGHRVAAWCALAPGTSRWLLVRVESNEAPRSSAAPRGEARSDA